MGNEAKCYTYTRGVKKEHPCTFLGCTAVFSKPSKLQYHLRRHTGERPFVCDEPNCNKTYLYSFHLRRHKEVHSKTTKVNRISCPYDDCFMELANEFGLKRHIKRKHNLKRMYPVTCDVCQQGFFKKRQLLEHSYVHTGIFPFKCEKCDTRFPSQHDRNRHMRTHSTYPCPCGVTFERWSELLQHKKTCAKIKYTCNVCDRAFKKVDHLWTHLYVHISDSVAEFYCGYENCFRVYFHKKNLIYHINVYHKNMTRQRIRCGYLGCNSSFTRKQNLKLHIDKCHKYYVKKQRRPRKDKGSHLDVMPVLVGFDQPTSSDRNCNNENKEVLAVGVSGPIIEILKRDLVSSDSGKTV